MSTSPTSAMLSPCIRVCALDADGYCTGCFRSREEITAWTRLSREEQEAVVERCRTRASASTETA